MFKNINIEKSLKNAQLSLLIMVLLTVVNIFRYFFNTGFYFPYSAFVPDLIMNLAIYYKIGFLYVIVVLILGIYVGIGLIAKSKPIWYVGAFVLFTLDTLILLFWMFLFLGFQFSSIVDLVFHGWIIYTLLQGSVAAYRSITT